MNTKGGGSGVAVSLVVMTVGGILIYSALTGLSIVDVVKGVKGDALDPKGGSKDPIRINLDTPKSGDTGSLAHGGTWTVPPGGSATFDGPNAALLDNLAGVAQNEFDLKVTATTNGGHSTNSWHKKKRAIDVSGSVENMRRFAEYVHKNYRGSCLELIHAPGFAVKNGLDVSPLFYAEVWENHFNHVHLAM